MELPILLNGREFYQEELTRMYEVDRKTILSDLRIIAETETPKHLTYPVLFRYTSPVNRQHSWQ